MSGVLRLTRVLRQVGAVTGAVALGLVLALAAHPAVVGELARPLADAVLGTGG